MLNSSRCLQVFAVFSLLLISACDSNQEASVTGTYNLVSMTNPEGFVPGVSSTTISTGQPLVFDIGGTQVTMSVSGSLTFTETGVFLLSIHLLQETALGSGTDSTELSGTYLDDNGTGTMETDGRVFTFVLDGDLVTVEDSEFGVSIVFQRI